MINVFSNELFPIDNGDGTETVAIVVNRRLLVQWCHPYFTKMSGMTTASPPPQTSEPALVRLVRPKEKSDGR